MQSPLFLCQIIKDSNNSHNKRYAYETFQNSVRGHEELQADLRIRKYFVFVRLVAVDVHPDRGARDARAAQPEDDPRVVLERYHKSLKTLFTNIQKLHWQATILKATRGHDIGDKHRYSIVRSPGSWIRFCQQDQCK